jgi:hypothetical protein
VLKVPGADSANNELLAQLELIELREFVAQSDCVAQIAVFGTKLMAVAIVAQLAVIGNVEPVDIVPGAALANNDLLAHDALIELKEFVAHNDWVAQTAVLGTKFIAVAIVAQLAVHGTVDPVATEFCFVPIKLITLELSQNDAVSDQLAVIGNVDPVEIVPGAASANNELEAQLELIELSEFVAQMLCVANTDVFGTKFIEAATVAQLAVIGNVEPVDIVPGAEFATNDREAQEALTVFNELVAQIDCVA